MNVEKEQTGNPGAIHHGCVNGEREESAEVKAAISCPSDRFQKEGKTVIPKTNVLQYHISSTGMACSSFRKLLAYYLV